MSDEKELQVGNVDDSADKNDTGGEEQDQPTELASECEPSETEKIEETPTMEEEIAPDGVLSAGEDLPEESPVASGVEAPVDQQDTEETEPVEAVKVEPEEESAVCEPVCSCSCMTSCSAPEPVAEGEVVEPLAGMSHGICECDRTEPGESTSEVSDGACVCDCACASPAAEPEPVADQPVEQEEAAPMDEAASADGEDEKVIAEAVAEPVESAPEASAAACVCDCSGALPVVEPETVVEPLSEEAETAPAESAPAPDVVAASGDVPSDGSEETPSAAVEAVVATPPVSALGTLFDEKTFAIPEDQWGYVDEYGNVWQRDCTLFTGRILGRIRAGDIEGGLLHYGEEFKELVSRCDRLAKEVKKAHSKGSYLFRVHQMKEHLPEAVAIGDFDGLMKKLTDIEQAIADGLEKSLRRKEELCVRAEALRESTDWARASKELREMQTQWRTLGQDEGTATEELWKRFRVALDAFFESRAKHFEERNAIQRENLDKREVLCKESEELCQSDSWKEAGERFEQIFEEWRKIGLVPKIEGDEQWKRFRKARAEFAKRRAQHFDDRKKQMRDSSAQKEALCEQAEALSSSSEWNKTATRIGELQEEWKQAGPSSKAKSDLLWKRFRLALDVFFDRRKLHYRQLDRERKENMGLKENICRVAEELINSPDLKSAMDQAKELQAEWRLIGPVPRDKSDLIWDRFRKACDAVFNASRENYRERVRDTRNRDTENKQQNRQNVERARRAIAEDEEQIQKWRDTIYRIHPGGRGEELKQSLEKRIADMEKSLVERRKRADEMERSPGKERDRNRPSRESRRSSEPRLMAVAEPEKLPEPAAKEEAKQPEPEVVEIPVEVVSEPETPQAEEEVKAEAEPEVAEVTLEPVEAEPEVAEPDPEPAETAPEVAEVEPVAEVVEEMPEVPESDEKKTDPAPGDA